MQFSSVPFGSDKRPCSCASSPPSGGLKIQFENADQAWIEKWHFRPMRIYKSLLCSAKCRLIHPKNLFMIFDLCSSFLVYISLVRPPLHCIFFFKKKGLKTFP